MLYTRTESISLYIYKFDIFVVIYEMCSEYVTEIKYTSELLDKNDMLFRGKIKLPRTFLSHFFSYLNINVEYGKKLLCKFHSLVAILGFEAAFLVCKIKILQNVEGQNDVQWHSDVIHFIFAFYPLR